MSDNFVNANGIFAHGYGFSPKLVMKDKALQIESKAIYAYLSSYAGNGMSAFPSVDLICHELGISRQRYNKHRKALEDAGYITVSQTKSTGAFSKNIYTLNVSPQSHLPTSQNVTTGIVTTENATTNSKSLNSNNLTSNKTKAIVELKPDIAEKVIQYLNKKTGKSFRPVKTHTDKINARIKEGATLTDLVRVIDRKCAEWLDDDSMSQYLRPATLFSAEKFNNYLGQVDAPMPAKRQSGSSANNEINFDSLGWMS